MAAPNPPMPRPMTHERHAPNERKRMVWNVFTHAVPRMPPKNT